MNTKELTEEISIWNRWSYSFINREIICFTDKVIDFDEKREMWIITYKPKAWFDNISINEFRELRKIPELRKNFRWFKDDWFTEEEKPIEAFENLFDDKEDLDK